MRHCSSDPSSDHEVGQKRGNQKGIGKRKSISHNKTKYRKTDHIGVKGKNSRESQGADRERAGSFGNLATDAKNYYTTR